jgi:CRISPR type III-B/RAMP module-associated protein Cmr5
MGKGEETVMNAAKNISHEMATKAYEVVNDWTSRDASVQKKIRSTVRSAGSLILSCGFTQATAFYVSKGFKRGDKNEKEGSYHLVAALIEWFKGSLEGKEKNQFESEVKQGTGLPDWLVKLGTDKYAFMSRQALSYVGWLKRYSEALLEEPDQEGDGR